MTDSAWTGIAMFGVPALLLLYFWASHRAAQSFLRKNVNRAAREVADLADVVIPEPERGASAGDMVLHAALNKYRAARRDQ